MGTQARLRVAHRWMAAGVLLIASVGGARAIGPRDARNGEECRAQVNAHFDAVEAEMLAYGNYRGIAVTEDEGRGPMLLDCKGFEDSLQGEQIAAALQRLSLAIDTLRTGHALTAVTIEQLATDRAGNERMPPLPYRHDWPPQYAQYHRYRSFAAARGAMATPGDSPKAGHRCGTPDRAPFSDQPCASHGSAPRAPLAETCHGLC